MFHKYYCIKQHDITDCGAACLATISKQYGLRTSISRIREVAGTDKQGTNAYGVIKAAEQLGFSAKGVKGDKNAFFSEFPLPCIAHVVVDGALLHYEVIHKITKKQVIIADPGKGIVKLSPEELFGEKVENGKPLPYQWTGVLILLIPNQSFKKGDETKGIFQRFFYLLLPQKRLILHVFVASTLITVFGIIGSFYYNEEKKLEPESLKGNIILKNVTFRYGTRKPVLENINMYIKLGERIALVGESGSGKTTLSKLLLNFYSPESGDILINNNNIKDINLETLREKIAYIPQETFLFSGSIMENLTLGLDDVIIEEVIEASKKAQAHEFINELPLRYETRLEENGTNLSGGQRQRLAIAKSR